MRIFFANARADAKHIINFFGLSGIAQCKVQKICQERRVNLDSKCTLEKGASKNRSMSENRHVGKQTRQQ